MKAGPSSPSLRSSSGSDSEDLGDTARLEGDFDGDVDTVGFEDGGLVLVVGGGGRMVERERSKVRVGYGIMVDGR